MPGKDYIDPTFDWDYARKLLSKLFPVHREPQGYCGKGIPVPWGELDPQHDLEELDREYREKHGG
jgi:hypothetical protein